MVRLISLGINPLKKGDVLVTSGAGGLYRTGIPVAVVTRLTRDGAIARVLSDPGVHQYCVRQGWLARPGEIAICAPNQVSLQIKGRSEPYDSLSY